MKNLILIASMVLASAAFANDPVNHGSAHGTTTQVDANTPATPTDKNAKQMKKHKGTKGEAHPKVGQPGDSTKTETKE